MSWLSEINKDITRQTGKAARKAGRSTRRAALKAKSAARKAARQAGAIVTDVDRQVGKGLKKTENWAEREQDWLIPAAIAAGTLGTGALLAPGLMAGAGMAGGAGAAGATGAAGAAGVAGGAAAGGGGLLGGLGLGELGTAGAASGAGAAGGGLTLGGLASGAWGLANTPLAAAAVGPAIGAVAGSRENARNEANTRAANKANQRRLNAIKALDKKTIAEGKATGKAAMARLEGTGAQALLDIEKRINAARNAAINQQISMGMSGGGREFNISGGAARSLGEAQARESAFQAKDLNSLSMSLANTNAANRQRLAGHLEGVTEDYPQQSNIMQQMASNMPSFNYAGNAGDGGPQSNWIQNLLGLSGGGQTGNYNSPYQQPAPVYGAYRQIQG